MPTAALAFDGIEDLLSSDSAVDRGDSPLSTLLETEVVPDRATPNPQASGKAPAERSWHSASYLGDDVVTEHEERGVAKSVDGKAAPPTAVNYVPEPSAMFLAAAALVYFWLFGRRRRLA